MAVGQETRIGEPNSNSGLVFYVHSSQLLLEKDRILSLLFSAPNLNNKILKLNSVNFLASSRGGRQFWIQNYGESNGKSLLNYSQDIMVIHKY